MIDVEMIREIGSDINESLPIQETFIFTKRMMTTNFLLSRIDQYNDSPHNEYIILEYILSITNNLF